MESIAKQKLEKLSKERLIDALMELSKDSEEARNLIAQLIAKPKDILKQYKLELAKIKGSKKFYFRGQSGDYAKRLSGLLKMLKNSGSDPMTGLLMLQNFFEADTKIFESCDDSNGFIGDVFTDEAKELFVQYAQQSEDKNKIVDILYKLGLKDDYSIRHVLFDSACEFLPNESLHNLLQKFQECETYKISESPYNSIHLKVLSLARQLKNMDLYIQLRWHNGEPNPAAFIDIAELYYENDDFESALQWLKKISPKTLFMASEKEKLLVRVYQALNQTKPLAEMLKKQFQSRPSMQKLKELLDVIGAEKQAEIISDKLEEISHDKEFDYTNFHFITEINSDEKACNYIYKHYETINGDFYNSYVPVAKFLQEKKLFIASSLVYRRLLISILERANSTIYSYGITYLNKLDVMANYIDSWNGFEDQKTFRQKLFNSHYRKTSFWGKYKHKMEKG
ncbi:MAG: hypothetical protein JXQ65_08995 [Candidatus Marinimicrobia bacterium]|nr:hypothetical protein [Candidatus Neomarinimicrobiota bacterium]